MAVTEMGTMSLARQLVLEKAGLSSWLHHHDTLLPVVLPDWKVQSPCRASAADVFFAAASAFQAGLVLTGLVSAVDLSKQ